MNHVGTGVLICPAERSAVIFSLLCKNRSSFGRLDGRGHPHYVVRGESPLLRRHKTP